MKSVRAFIVLLIPALLLSSVPPNALHDTDITEPPSFSVPTASAVPQSPAASNWHIETVDSEEYAGWYTSLALDSSDRPQISYHAKGPPPWYTPPTGGDLKHAWYDGAAWQVATVASGGRYTSLTLDASGRPHISYQEGGHLNYAWNGGRSWQIETVDGEVWVGEHTSLALDGLGRPHISYHGYWPPPPLSSTVEDEAWGEGYLKYAWHDGADWHTQVVDSYDYAGGYTSLALDESDRPHISYYDSINDDLKHAWHDGTDWHIETVDSAGDVGAYTSLVLDGAGRPHISYSGGGLKYARHDGTDWHIETVDSGRTYYTSLALDVAGRPHIGYSNNGGLKYAWHDGTDWHVEMVDSGGRYTSLALDGAGRPHISYYSGRDLKYARPMPSPVLDKRATPTDGLRNSETLTYTLTLSGPGLSVRLWDPLPANVHYITGSVTLPAVYSPTVRAIVWQGTLPIDSLQVVRFRVTPGVTGTGALSVSQPIVNTAWLSDTYSGFGVSATVIVNGWRVYLPRMLGQSR